MNKEEQLRIIEDMQAVVAQMKIDDLEEDPSLEDEMFECSCCGKTKSLAGSIPYSKYRLCNDCVLLAETGLAIGKFKNIQELINEGKFIEACEQSQAKFEETGDLLMLFYWTMLDADFTHKLPFDKIYDNLLKVKKVVPTKMQVQYNYYLAVASYNITDYYEAYKAAKNVISAEIPNAVAHLIYASTIVILGYNENFLYHLDKAIEYGEDDDTIDAQVYNIKLDYYIKHNKREEINKLMDEIYLKMKDRSFINACKLKIALLDLDENEIDELIKPLLLDRNVNTCIMLYDCADKFAEGGKFEKALEFARMNLAINVDMRDHILLQIGKISLAMYDTDEALEIFEDLKNSQDQEILSELPLLIAQSLAMSQDRKQTMQGLEKFYELYKQNNSPYYLIQLARTYDSAKIPLPNFILDELEIQRIVAKKRNNNEILGQIFELLQQEYIRRGKFTQATIILNEEKYANLRLGSKLPEWTKSQ